MDDRELEARLRTRLHARFDDAQVPSELATNVRQAFGTTTRRVGFDLRVRGRILGWSAVAAAVAIALVAIGFGTNTLVDPGTGATPSPAPTDAVGANERHFIVLAPAGLPSKPESSLAGDVLAARVQALGIGNFNLTWSIGYAIQFNLPADGPSDASIRAVLQAIGDVEFVPLPAADYGLGAGKRQATVGQPLPKAEPPLFGWEGIESIISSYDTATSKRTVNVTLKPLAAVAFADSTMAHETFAILIDGRVAVLPVIDEAITGGEVNVSGGAEEDFAVTAAIMVGGMLPEAWRGASVPAIVSEEFAINVAKGQFPYNPVATSSLSAEPDGDGWRAVWLVEVTGVVSAVIPCLTPGPGATCAIPSQIRRVVIDAVSGKVIRIETPTE